MRSIFVVVGGVILIGLVVAAVVGFKSSPSTIASYNEGDPNAPVAEIAEKNFDFGKIKESDTVTHDFKIKNTGKSPLVIMDVMTSCHCTSAVVKIPGQADSPTFTMSMNDWKAEIAPDSEGTIEVIYKPFLMPVSGRVSRVVTATTNDPKNKQIQLEIIADVE